LRVEPDQPLGEGLRLTGAPELTQAQDLHD
jgi:hypothetical protein